MYDSIVTDTDQITTSRTFVPKRFLNDVNGGETLEILTTNPQNERYLSSAESSNPLLDFQNFETIYFSIMLWTFFKNYPFRS